MKNISSIRRFFEEDIWKIRLQGLYSLRAMFLKLLRIFLLATYEFRLNNCAKRATVLTYYSLLNLVPLMAVLFAIAKGFGLKRIVEGHIIQLSEKAHLQPEITNQIISFSNKVLIQTKGGIVAGVGVVLLFWTVISILGRVEETFNTIWKVERQRTLVRKFTDYIAVIVFAPVLFAISSSITVLIATHLKEIIKTLAISWTLHSTIFFLLSFSPYFSMWILMIGLYIIIPNIKIRVKSAFFAGLMAGTIYQIVQWIYIKFQIGVAGHSAIYGSFAALPLFLGWLQLSWMILIFGCEISYAYEHHETFGFHPDYSRVCYEKKRLLMLTVFRFMIINFVKGEVPHDPKTIAQGLEIPLTFVKKILSELKKAGLVVEVIDESGQRVAYQPARSIEGIKIKTVFDLYENYGNNIPDLPSEDYIKLKHYLQEISESIESSSGNVRMIDI